MTSETVVRARINLQAKEREIAVIAVITVITVTVYL